MQLSKSTGHEGHDNGELSLTVRAVSDQLDRVNEFVGRFLSEQDCSMKTLMQFELCVEEIFVNIVSYAYGGSIPGDAQIRVSREGDEIRLVFIDSGKPYDPLAKPDPDTTLSADVRPIGGLGIFLVKKNMDQVLYRYEDGKNILTLIKKIG